MNLIFFPRVSLALVICFTVVPHTAGFAAEPPLSIEEVAQIFGYPAEKLKVEEVTEQVNRRAERKGKPQAISVHTFSGANNTFARLSIAVTGGGGLLTEDMKRYAAEAIASGLPNANLPVKWLNLNDAGYGITGIGMTGPGGSEERAIITLFNNTDVQVTISIPGESPLQILPGAEAYHDLINQGGIRGRLIDSLSTVASKVAGKPIQAVLTDTAPAGAALSAPIDRPANRPQAPSIQGLPENNVAAVPVASSKAKGESPSKPLRFWWTVALLAVLALFTWRVARRRA